MHPLPHTDQAQARCGLPSLNVESCTIITNAETKFLRRTDHFNLNRFGPAMFCDIVERFLNDSKERKCYIVIQLCGNSRTGACNLDRVLFGELPAQLCDRNRQTQEL